MTNSTRLTDRQIKNLGPSERANKIHYDSEVKGFGLRVTAKGAKSFVLNYRIRGRERRYTIGSYPDWSVIAARAEARELKRRIDLGEDPMGERHTERAAPTVAEMAKRYMDEHCAKKAPRSQIDEQAMLDKCVLPGIGMLKVFEVTHDHIADIHRSVSKTRPIRANRIVQMLSKMFNLAIRWGYVEDNPVRGIEKNPEGKRVRYLSTNEIDGLMEAMDHHPNQTAADLVRMLLLTGARLGETRTAAWNQFDLEAGVWTKPSAHTKQRQVHRIPLSASAIDLLKKRYRGSSSIYVFPSKSGLAPIADIKRFWSSVTRTAGLTDCRIHDLRHTHASILASQNLSLPIIGALLGHTQAQTTARYTHLFDEPLRQATELVAGSLKRQSSGV